MIVEYEKLLGQQYQIGKSDCYSLIRQFYKENFGLNLRNYARPQQWWLEDMNLYQENFRKEGFETIDIPITEVEIGDCLLMAFSSTFPNHAGIYVGDNKVVHHFYNTLSRCDNFRSGIRNSLTAIIRHPDAYTRVQKEKEKVYKKVDIQQLVLGKSGYVIPEEETS